MSKEDVLNNLKASREVNTMEETENWRNAFKLFNDATGSKIKASDRCSKCYQKVLDWLQK